MLQMIQMTLDVNNRTRIEAEESRKAETEVRRVEPQELQQQS